MSESKMSQSEQNDRSVVRSEMAEAWMTWMKAEKMTEAWTKQAEKAEKMTEAWMKQAEQGEKMTETWMKQAEQSGGTKVSEFRQISAYQQAKIVQLCRFIASSYGGPMIYEIADSKERAEMLLKGYGNIWKSDAVSSREPIDWIESWTATEKQKVWEAYWVKIAIHLSGKMPGEKILHGEESFEMAFKFLKFLHDLDREKLISILGEDLGEHMNRKRQGAVSAEFLSMCDSHTERLLVWEFSKQE